MKPAFTETRWLFYYSLRYFKYGCSYCII